jgi:hypothetical protein
VPHGRHDFPWDARCHRPVEEEVAALPSAEIILYTADLPGAEILEYSMTRQ